MKPKGLMRAKVASEPMRPMFGPFQGTRSGTYGRSARWTSNFHARAVARRPPGPRADRRRLWVGGRRGVVLVHELRAGRFKKNSLIAATTGRMLIQRLGHGQVRLLGGHALAHGCAPCGRAECGLALDELADGADATVGEIVDVVDLNADLDRLAICGADEGLVAREARRIALRSRQCLEGQRSADGLLLVVL